LTMASRHQWYKEPTWWWEWYPIATLNMQKASAHCVNLIQLS